MDKNKTEREVEASACAAGKSKRESLAISSAILVILTNSPAVLAQDSSLGRIQQNLIRNFFQVLKETRIVCFNKDYVYDVANIRHEEDPTNRRRPSALTAQSTMEPRNLPIIHSTLANRIPTFKAPRRYFKDSQNHDQ